MSVSKSKIHIWMAVLAVFFIFLSSLFFKTGKILSIDDNHKQIENILYGDNFSLDLTDAEKRWLKANPAIHLGIDHAFPPFGSITDEHEYIGFTADIMQLVAYRLGFTFYIEKDATWAETIEMAKKGQIDMIAALVNTPQRQKYLEFTRAYIKTPTIIINDSEKNGYIGSLDKLKGKRVAIEQGSFAESEIKQKYPEIKLVPVKNTSMALSLVSIGSADAYVGNAVTASFIIRKLAYHNLSFSGETEYSSDHSVGIIKPNKQLLSVVQKALDSISRHDLDAITNYWFGMKTSSFVSKRTALIVSSIFMTIILFFCVWIVILRRTKSILKKAQDELIQQSEIDYLTGLGNRRKFYRYLEEKIEENNCLSKSFSLLFLDLDLFKEVNDSLGHEAGDLLLKQASKRIVKCVKAFNGFVARIGGDEFIIILSSIHQKATLNIIAECIRSRLNAPFYIKENEIFITTSIGITRFPKDAVTARQLVINGDQAMYQSKKMGRNYFSYFNEQMFADNQYKSNLIRDLHKAHQNQEFELHYQPIIDLSDNTVCKAEALIRWSHPQRGSVSPAEFIPLAEEGGLINGIGDWIFKQAIDDTVDLCRQYRNDFQMTINTSPLQFRRNGMDVSKWFDYLDSLGLSGNNIVVEITEGILMETSPAVRNNLLKIRDKNIDIAIDDFGTGYSSLSYLKKFNVDYLKIDQSFIKNMTTEPDDITLVRAIIVMAHRLGIKVVAEGIETERQKMILVDAGCDYGQGFYFAKGLSKTELLAFLAKGEKNSSSHTLAKNQV